MKHESKTGLRVVLDTNVYISALVFPKSKIAALWQFAINNRYTAVVSPFIVRELMRKLRDKFGYPEQARETIKKKMIQVVKIAQPKAVPAVIAEDPDDDHILACAIEGSATLIVSGNKHLLRLKKYRGIPIIRPMDFLRTFEKIT